MKNLVRAFVVVLTLSGSAAYTKLAVSAPANHTAPSIAAQTNVIPLCPPDDPNACGIRKR